MSPFEIAVLRATMKIPLGETRTYAQIARAVGRPGAGRAVGQALKKNPFAPLVPCHRVIRTDGTPGGYGGKFDGRKEAMLKKEQLIVALLGK